MNIKFNKFKTISHIILVSFFILSTFQTLFEIQIFFKTILGWQVFLSAVAASAIPVLFLLFIMKVVNEKTKYHNLFVIPEIKYIIRTLFYISLFAIFLFWSITLIFVVGFFIQGYTSFQEFAIFLLSRILFTTIYSIVVALFFNGMSDIEFKIPKKIKNIEEKNELQ